MAAVAAAVGMALGVVLGDFASPATARGGRLERLPVPAAAAAAEAVAPELPVLAERRVRNVVLLIGDGMGLTQLAAGRILALGIDGRFHVERFPTVGLLTTHAAGALVTMSDAAATAFAAHVGARRDEARIAEQLSAARVDLLVGGGRGYFLPRRSTPVGGGRDLVAEMRARGVEVVDDAAGLEAATRLPLAALFAVEPQQSEPRSPTPEAMARKAIELLSGSERPFFLLVEDEEIDTAAHANDGARMSGALRRFDAAVAAAAAFAAGDGETLVLVLGDHATGGLTIDSRSRGREIGLLWGGRGHTGEPVPTFAYGPPSAAGRFAGMHDNTEIPGLLAAALGVEFPHEVAAE